jgi:hypothetical protein
VEPTDREPDVELHTMLPTCVACGRAWDDIRERWQTYLLDDEGQVFYCPGCAARAFGG